MSKTIQIPSDKGNPVFVTLNGKKYTYTAGETVSVPDEVAALFDNNDGENVIYGRRATAPLEAPKRKGDGGGIPILTDDEGNLYGDGGSSIDAIYVEGHKLIIPQAEE